MTEYTKIETAMAIICDRCKHLYLDEFCPEKRDFGKCGWRRYLEEDAADVAPVVRCWDCKHCDPENYHCDHPMGTAAPLKRKPDDFCSYGELKEGAD